MNMSRCCRNHREHHQTYHQQYDRYTLHFRSPCQSRLPRYTGNEQDRFTLTSVTAATVVDRLAGNPIELSPATIPGISVVA